jgi:hypothetical protein
MLKTENQIQDGCRGGHIDFVVALFFHRNLPYMKSNQITKFCVIQ